MMVPKVESTKVNEFVGVKFFDRLILVNFQFPRVFGVVVDRTVVAKIHDGPSRFYNFVIAQDRNGPPLDQKTTNRFLKPCVFYRIWTSPFDGWF
jgi:hypothetical protein